MKRTLISYLIISLIIISGCKKDDEPPVFTPPTLTILNSPDPAIERGQTFSLELKLEAEAGIDQLTLDGEVIEGIEQESIEQFITIPIQTVMNSNVGNQVYEFILTDLQGGSITEEFTLFLSPGEEIQSDSVTLFDNTILVPESIELASSESQLSQGVYAFSSESIDVSPGDVIYGPQGGGYLRKVESVNVVDGMTIINTTAGLITDLFKETDIEFGLNELVNDFSAGVSGGTDFREDIDFELNEFISLNGYVELVGQFNLGLEVINGKLQSIGLNTKGTSVELNLTTTIAADGKVEETEEYEIYSISRPFFSISPPLFGRVKFDLNARVDASIEGEIQADVITREKIGIDFGVMFENGTWQHSLNIEELVSTGVVELDGIIELNSQVSLIPGLEIELFGVGGPYFKPEGFAEFDLGVNPTNLDWDALVNVGYRGSFGFEADLLDFTIGAEFPIEENKSQVWSAPHSLEIVDRQDYQLFVNQQSHPLRTKVTDDSADSLGIPLVPVHFRAIENQGSIDNPKALTNLDGVAESSFTAPGTPQEALKIRAEIRDRNSEPIDFKEFEVGVSNDPIEITFPPGMFTQCNQYAEVEGVRMRMLSAEGFNGPCNALSGAFGSGIWLTDIFRVELLKFCDISKVLLKAGGGCRVYARLLEWNDDGTFREERIEKGPFDDNDIIFQNITGYSVIEIRGCGEATLAKVLVYGPD